VDRLPLVIAEHGVISTAAKQLRISHPTLSRRLQRIERRLGTRIFARKPHGLMEELDYEEMGTWQIDQGELCQIIPRVGSGSTVCFELRRTSKTKIQMYYTRCGAMTRCYPGRLGPDGELFPGRVFTR
jgi:hypothetical protein